MPYVSKRLTKEERGVFLRLNFRPTSILRSILFTV